jgi:GNAT superfamily N-acetyltransferase
MKTTAIAERFACLPAADDLHVALKLRAGSLADYHALAAFHYRDAPPATASRVLMIEHATVTAADRFHLRDPQPRCVAVLVESMPMLNAAMRDVALARRYGAIRSMRRRASLINAELRCISRVVVHPQYRGLGLAVKLVRHALATATTCYTEAFAAMGHINPFFEHAGMRAYHRAPHCHDQRLVDALARVGITPADLAMMTTTLATIDAMSPRDQQWLSLELRRWFRTAFRGKSTIADDLTPILTAARKRLFCPPVYYLNARQPQR